MQKKCFYFIFSLLFFSILYACSHENAFFRITKNDIKLRVPKEFPALVYDFSKNPITPAGFVLGRKLFYDPIFINS